LQDFAGMNSDVSLEYAMAEGGVFQGDFAKEINRCFPQHRLFLFDTFAGFDERDVRKEHSNGGADCQAGHLKITSVELVIDKMLFPDAVEIRKGYFPETTAGLENEKFFFVNLDFDLYNPTLEGIRFFYPRLHEDGVLLIHDYYNSEYIGVKKAVDDYEQECGDKIIRFPIGDHCSIAILKK